MNVKKTARRMIPALPAAVKILSQMLSQYIPNEESPGNSFASDSLSFLTRLITPGLSALFPLIAAPIIDALLPGAASPGGDRC